MYPLYSLAWLLLLPVAFLYLLWRSRRQPDYRVHWAERLGFVPKTPALPIIWIHAVSVGETQASAPLIRLLQARFPQYRLYLTHATPTGRATARQLFGDDIHQAYLPYDLPACQHLFLRRVRPSLGIIMETEIWPNLLHACHTQQIPVLLVNARLSARSARRYQWFAPLTRQALRDLHAIAAQTGDDAARLAALGGRAIEVTGNLKFDVTPPQETGERAAVLRQQFAGRFVFLCASTREGEEALLLDALSRIAIPGLLIVLVPRHPQRFTEVADLLRARALPFARRSLADTVTGDTRVFLGDSMGEMATYYAAADACYVGGSLLPFGGQNLIEAAAAGCPALIGPHTWNFTEAAQLAITHGAAKRVNDLTALQDTLLQLHADPAQRNHMAQAGETFAAANRGATQRVLAMVESCLEDPKKIKTTSP